MRPFTSEVGNYFCQKFSEQTAWGPDTQIKLNKNDRKWECSHGPDGEPVDDHCSKKLEWVKWKLETSVRSQWSSTLRWLMMEADGRLWWPKAKGREEKKETGGDVVEWQQNKEMSSIGGHCRYLPSSPALLWAQETRISDVLCATEKSVHLSFSFSFAQNPTFSPGGTGSWELIRVAWKDTSGGEWSDCVKSVWRGRLIEDSTTGFLHNSSSQWNKWLWLWGFQETDAKCQNQEKYATETPHRKHLHCYFPPLIHSPVETVMTTIL